MTEVVTGEQMAILSSRLRKVTEKMANTLFRSARSGVINTARDFSCCLITADNEMIEVAEALPIQVMSGPELSARYMVARHPHMRRGDAFLHNSPYHGGGHAADHQILVPIFDALGHHKMTAVVKAHMADIGNAVPTTVNPSVADVFQEGALIFPAVQVQRDYQTIEDIVAMCEVRIRNPSVWRGDFMAMIGAARTAEKEIIAIAAEIGWDLLDAHVQRWLDYSEERMIEAIRTLPAGKATARSQHDAQPGVTEAIPIAVSVDCRPDDGRIIIDLTDNPDCLPTGMNLTESTALSAARSGAYCGIPSTVPKNSGSFRRIEIRLRENCCIGIPRHPASCSAATTSLPGRVAGMVQVAMSELGEGIGMAEHGVVGHGIVPVMGADMRRGGAQFLDVMSIAWGNGGGGPLGDGLLGDTSLTGGIAYRHAVETCELQLPVCVWIDRLEQDTAAAGKFRGAPAHRLEWSPIDAPVFAMWVGEGGSTPARGVRGGKDGVCNQMAIIHADGTRDIKLASGMALIQPGERYSSLSGGGGGYGDPTHRSRAAVIEDIAEGIISREVAAHQYGLSQHGSTTEAI